MDPLREELRRLARRLDEHGIRLIVGAAMGYCCALSNYV
jgi:hypothetical protein